MTDKIHAIQVPDKWRGQSVEGAMERLLEKEADEVTLEKKVDESEQPQTIQQAPTQIVPSYNPINWGKLLDPNKFYRDNSTKKEGEMEFIRIAARKAKKNKGKLLSRDEIKQIFLDYELSDAQSVEANLDEILEPNYNKRYFFPSPFFGFNSYLRFIKFNDVNGDVKYRIEGG